MDVVSGILKDVPMSPDIHPTLLAQAPSNLSRHLSVSTGGISEALPDSPNIRIPARSRRITEGLA